MIQGFRPSGPLGMSPGGGGGRVPGPLGIGPGVILFGDAAAVNVAAKKRSGTLVLYVRPTDPKPQMKGKVEYRWAFDTAEGRREYETALNKHLKEKKILSGDATYEPLSGSSDIARLATDAYIKLVLIVHSASNGPAIGVDLGNAAAGTKADWLKDDKVADILAPLGYSNITVLGCDAVSNKFTSNLARRLPEGATVTGHAGGDFEIRRHFDFSEKVPGHLNLTRLKSNMKLKTFNTEGKAPATTSP